MSAFNLRSFASLAGLFVIGCASLAVAGHGGGGGGGHGGGGGGHMGGGGGHMGGGHGGFSGMGHSGGHVGGFSGGYHGGGMSSFGRSSIGPSISSFHSGNSFSSPGFARGPGSPNFGNSLPGTSFSQRAAISNLPASGTRLNPISSSFTSRHLTSANSLPLGNLSSVNGARQIANNALANSLHNHQHNHPGNPLPRPGNGTGNWNHNHHRFYYPNSFFFGLYSPFYPYYRSPYYYGGYGLGMPYYGYGGYGYYGSPYFSYSSVYSCAQPAYVVQTPIDDAAQQPLPPPAEEAKKDFGGEEFAVQGEADFRAGRYPQAIHAWQHALVDDPRNGGYVMLLAQALFATGRYNEAAGALQQGTQMMPAETWGVVIQNYKELYPNIGDYTNQLRALEKALAATPEDAGMRFLLGWHYGYLGYPKDAVRELERAVELAPKDEVAQKVLDAMKAKL